MKKNISQIKHILLSAIIVAGLRNAAYGDYISQSDINNNFALSFTISNEIIASKNSDSANSNNFINYSNIKAIDKKKRKYSGVTGFASSITDAIDSASGTQTYEMTGDEVLSGTAGVLWLGGGSGTNLTISGNNYSIIGSGSTEEIGLVGEQILTFENVTMSSWKAGWTEIIDNAGTLNLVNIVFDSGQNSGVSSGLIKNQKAFTGGAVLNVQDSKFTNNTGYFGTIYNYSGNTTNISAINDDVVFSGNSALGGKNRDFSNEGTLNLNAADGKTIFFESSIGDHNNATAIADGTITKNGEGFVYFGGDLNQSTVTLNAGTMKFGSEAILRTNATTLNGGRLDVQNNAISQYSFKTTTLGGDVALALDVNLSDFNADSFKGTSFSNPGNNKITIDGVNLYNEVSNKLDGYIPIVYGNIDKSAFKLSNQYLLGDLNLSKNYYIGYNSSLGALQIASMDLTKAIEDNAIYRNYTLFADETSDLGVTSTGEISVWGNHNAINVNSGSRWNIAVGEIVNIHDIGSAALETDNTVTLTNSGLNGADTKAIIATGGTLNIDNSVFSLNKSGVLSNIGAKTTVDNSFFYNNSVSGSNNGGALYNNSGILTITGSTFVENSAEANGGAIYNGVANTNITNSNFINNYVQSAGSIVKGGAIYTTADINLTADGNIAQNDGKFNLSGNYISTDNGETKQYEAIYVNSNSATLTLSAINNGEFIINDYINGLTGYNVHLTGDESGVINLYNDLKLADVTVDNVSVCTANNDYHNYTVNSITSNANANWTIDFDATNKRADIISSTGNSSGIITLNSLNIAGDFTGVNSDYKVQIINNTDESSLQLALSDDVVAQLGGNSAHKIFETINTVNEQDHVSASTIWTDILYNWHHDDIVEHNGIIGLTTTTTANDSIGYIESSTNTIVGTRVNDNSLGDTLKLVNNDTNIAAKTFRAGADGATYVVSENLGATIGSLSINGIVDGSVETLNLNNKTGFEVGMGAVALNFNNITVGGSTTIANVTNNLATIGLNNTTLNGNITGSDFVVNTSGTTNLNGTVGGNISNYGTLNSAITNILGSITNIGTFNMTGDLSKNIAGKGSTVLQSTSAIVTSDITIEGNLNPNGNTIVMNDSMYQSLSVANLTGNGNLSLNVNAQTDSADSINITDGNYNNSVLTITALDFTKPTVVGDSATYSKQILTGITNGASLALSSDVTDVYNISSSINRSGSDDLTSNNISWNDVYGAWTQSGTKTEAVSITSSSGTLQDTLTYTIDKSWNSKSYTSNAENLALINQYDGVGSDNRTINFAGISTDPVAQGTYTVRTDAGVTATGQLTINGETSGQTKTVIDFNANKGFELNNDNTTLIIKDAEIKGSSSLISGNAATGVKVTLDNVNIHDNGTGIQTAGNIEIKGNSNISDKIEVSGKNSKVDIDGSNGISINSSLTGTGTSTLNISNGTVNFGNQANISGFEIAFQNTNMAITNESSLNNLNVTFNGTNNLDIANGNIGTLMLGNFNLNGLLKMSIDADLANETIDKLMASNVVIGSGGRINVEKINLLSPTSKENLSLLFTDNKDLANIINYTGENTIVYSPIYKYITSYKIENGLGYFNFRAPAGQDKFNPAIMIAPVAAQLGGYFTQLNSYDEAFRNMDMYMLMTAAQRQALKNKNKIASLDGRALYDATLARQERAEGWFRPYATFEKVPLKNGPKVENIAYGSYMGGESQMYDLGHGWDGMWGAYVGYNGSHQTYKGNSIYQNGGSLGLTGMAYKGNFFTGLTLNSGANGAKANTMYGSEDFSMLMAGIANKTGYNWELFNGKFIIQPSALISYSFVNTFDYRNSAGVKINSDPLHAIQVQPEIKFIGNLKNGWQPYASAAMVWNIMDDTKFKANDVSLPELSVKPYVKYGVGIRKTWGESFTGFFQTYVTNGGRNGVGLQAGFTWTFGGGKNKNR